MIKPINAAIDRLAAEVCGWTGLEEPDEEGYSERGFPPSFWHDKKGNDYQDFPHYCTDKETHGALAEVLQTAEAEPKFSREMRNVCEDLIPDYWRQSRTFAVTFAPAKCVVIAFLIAMDRWPSEWEIPANE